MQLQLRDIAMWSRISSPARNRETTREIEREIERERERERGICIVGERQSEVVWKVEMNFSAQPGLDGFVSGNPHTQVLNRAT